jgi:hypothetical protein
MIGILPTVNELCQITGYNLTTFTVAAVIVPGMTRIVGNPETTSQPEAERRKFRLAGEPPGSRCPALRYAMENNNGHSIVGWVVG